MLGQGAFTLPGPVALNSILRWQQNGCGAAICFGDDPDLLALNRSVYAQQTKAISKRDLIFLCVILRDLAPISRHMSSQELNRRLACHVKRVLRSGCNEGFTKCEACAKVCARCGRVSVHRFFSKRD